MVIKPIETRYKGYLFRSRLEARWAVFFDALGIRFEYEPEGFDLGGGDWYLPDFYFPEGSYLCGGSYGEVKPFQGMDYFSDSIQGKFPLVHKFIKRTNKIIILFDGPPDFYWYYRGYRPEEEEVEWAKDGVCWSDDAMLYDQAMNDNRWFTSCGCSRDKMDEDFFEDKYKKAVYAARSARF